MTAPERPEARATTGCYGCTHGYPVARGIHFDNERMVGVCVNIDYADALPAAPLPAVGEPNPYALDGEALVEAMEIAAGVDAALDGQRIALVHQLRHRVGTRHNCRCEECRAISRVCALAREAIAMKAAKRRRADPAEGG